MTRIFDDFEVGKRALLAQQAVLNTVGHNMANAGTPGYSRQRADLVPVRTQNGVEVSAIRRIRDRFLDISLLTELCEKARGEAFEMMIEHAEQLGANAIIGVRYDATEVMQGITEVLCYGTAVVVR